LHDEVLARHRALDDGLATLRAPLDDPALLHAQPIPELSVELTPMPLAPAPPPPGESFAADHEDDDAVADFDDDVADFDEGDEYDDYGDEDDDEDEDDDDRVATASPGGLAWADSVRPSEQRKSIDDSAGGEADPLEHARWDQPQFGLNLPPEQPGENLPQPERTPDQFAERLRQAVGEDETFDDPAFEDKATKFFEEDEPTSRRRFGRRG
jgi:hypothetical protein